MKETQLIRVLTVLCALAAGLFQPLEVHANDYELEQKLDADFAAGKLSGLHSVVIMQKDQLLAEKYYSGNDERWGVDIGEVQAGPRTLHDLRGITSVIVGLLYGIALNEGLVPGPEASLMASFPEYPKLGADAGRQKIQVKHVLSMQMGTEWDENLPYTDPRNSEAAMERADDRYEYILSRPIKERPGQRWTYNGGAAVLIARLIEKGTGRSIDAYAKEKLFDPLGVENFEWVRSRDGTLSAASGLRLTIRDLAKIGQLVLNKGQWKGEQIVTEGWLRQSWLPHARTQFDSRYGYLWWLSARGAPPKWGAASGLGGQRLLIYPASGLIIAIFAGNYRKPDPGRLPVRIITDYALPALLRHQ